MADRRDKPYIHISWIPRLLLGSNMCKWAAWHRTHFKFNKKGEFDAVSYNLKHTALRNQLLQKDLAGRDCNIFLEQKIYWEEPQAILGGSVDVVAVKDNRGMIFEVKSGNENAADKVQCMIYMWALPKAQKRFQNVLFDGMLYYPDKRVKIAATEVDENFTKILKDFIKDILHNEPERRFPSERECLWCNIADCDERISEGEAADERPDGIPSFLD